MTTETVSEVRISNDHSVEHKNGYWIHHTHKTTKKGVEYKSSTKTYLKMLDMWNSLKLIGGCGEDIMKAVQVLIDDEQKKTGLWVMAERAKKAAKLAGEL